MSLLSQLWKGWKRIGQFLGDALARIVLSIFYFTVFAPFGLGLRARGDPLGIKHNPEPEWLDRVTTDRTLQDARRLS